MYGAIIGDMIGSPYEWDNIKTKDFQLFISASRYTDDSIMTVAVADAIMAVDKDADEITLKKSFVSSMQKWGRRYSDAGYGGYFIKWLYVDDPKPYGSYGNGSAMRVSPIGWYYDSLERTKEVAKWSAEVSHNHPDAIKGAQAVATAIYLARQLKKKDEIKEHIIMHYGYELSQSCDEIRPWYKFDVSCQGTVPIAFIAFFEGNSFEDVVRNAVSLGGDCDTLTCIAAGIAEAFYKIPDAIRLECSNRLPTDVKEIVMRFEK